MALLARHTRRKIQNALFVTFTCGATALALAALLLILGSLVAKGLGGFSLAVFTMDQPAPDELGGLRNAIAGSMELCLLAMALALVVGLLAGTWLAEFGRDRPLARALRFCNDVLLSAPSILVGLFVYEVMVRPMQGFSALAGVVALAVLASPVVTRTTEDILRLQPSDLREAGLALGAAQAQVVRKILWRAARPGLVTGALLGFARISGETAPLLFTALGNPNLSLRLDEPIGSLPGVIFQFALSAYEDWQALAWVGALLIAATVLMANVLGRALARRSLAT